MKIILKKVLLFGLLLLSFVCVQMLFGNLYPLDRSDLSWGVTAKYHFFVYCGIVGIYSLLFPMSIGLYTALLFQTISFYFFFSSTHPLRLIEMNVVAYLCIVVPFIIQKYLDIYKLFPSLKKRSCEEWAKNLCIKALEKMPDEYSVYVEELKAGIIWRVIPDLRSSPYRYNFFFDTSVSEKYELSSEPYFYLEGFVLNNANVSNVALSIVCARGLIAGFSLSVKEKIDITDLQVDVKNVQKKLIVEQLPKAFRKAFHEIHSKYPQINISEIYEVKLDGRCIYHLLDIGDGDFVGYEMSNGFVKVCHDGSETISNIADLDEFF